MCRKLLRPKESIEEEFENNDAESIEGMVRRSSGFVFVRIQSSVLSVGAVRLPFIEADGLLFDDQCGSAASA